MINLINGMSPPGYSPAEEGRRSGDGGAVSFTKELNSKSQAESFKKILKDEGKTKERITEKAPQSAEQSPKEVRQERGPDRSERKEVRGKSKEREAEQAQTSSSRKKTQGSKEQIFQEFMASFESETGIPSARIAEALAQVASQPDGQKSPEETADLVLEQLNLSPEKEDRARELYIGFLAETKVQQTAAPVVIADLEQMKLADRPHMLERVQQNQMRKMDLNKRLDQLNQKFWMTKGNSVMQEQMPLMDQQETAILSGFEARSTFFDQQLEREIAALGIDPKTLTDQDWSQLKAVVASESLGGGGAVEGTEQAALEQAQLSALADMLEQKLSQTEAGRLAEGKEPLSTEEAMMALYPHYKVQDQENQSRKSGQESMTALNLKGAHQKNPEAVAATQAFQQSPQKGDSFESYLSQGQRKGAGLAGAKAEGFEASLRSAAEGMNSLAGLSGQPESLKSLNQSNIAPVPLTTGQQLEANPAAKESVQNIIQQAQYLVQKGGGEMNVKMTPEGLGEIHIKVAMNDGKVNVQLATETDEAKKLFESNIADLKSHLSAHKISMENLKVDVVHQTNTEQNVQSQLNQQNLANQQQQQTRQFWNQFQENFGNRSQRDGFLDFSNSRRAEQEKDPLQPVDSKGRVSGRKLENKGRGLNLVA